ncbi:MAG: hypothetical protein FWF90_11615 [Promicromonosporaceae bacterium]|nr:hypothetical protein [Promicromonosporaceae bacterium]
MDIDVPHRLRPRGARLLNAAAATALALGGSAVADWSALAQGAEAKVSAATSAVATVPTGLLVFHTYVSYADGSGRLWVHDVGAQTTTDVSAGWVSGGLLRDPMNGVISPDGRYLLFMAISEGEWNVFAWHLDTADDPVNLTKNGDPGLGLTWGRNEDPKWSPDGSRVYWKHEGDIVTADVDIALDGTPSLSGRRNLTNTPWDRTANTGEDWMPYPAPDDSVVYYTTGVGVDADIWMVDTTTGTTTAVAATPGVQEYYPVLAEDGTLYYARWASTSTRDDEVWARSTTGVHAPAPFNLAGANSSDPWPVPGTTWVVFVATESDGFYHLYAGDSLTGNTVALATLGLDVPGTNILGPAYWSGT